MIFFIRKTIIIFIVIIAAIGCEKTEKESTHEEIMYQMAVDTLTSIGEDFYGPIVLNSDSAWQIYLFNFFEEKDFYAEVEVVPMSDSVVINYHRVFVTSNDFYRIPIPYSMIKKFVSMWRICVPGGVIYGQEPEGGYYYSGQVLMIHLKDKTEMDYRDYMIE